MGDDGPRCEEAKTVSFGNGRLVSEVEPGGQSKGQSKIDHFNSEGWSSRTWSGVRRDSCSASGSASTRAMIRGLGKLIKMGQSDPGDTEAMDCSAEDQRSPDNKGGKYL